jgi:hypothetical protein
MTPYWILFGFAALCAITNPRPQRKATALQGVSPLWLGTFLILALMIGLRHEVGGDWGNYLDQLELVTDVGFLESINPASDPAYALLNWIGANVAGGVYLVNLLCGLLFTWGLLSFCRVQPRPWLAVVIAIPYLVIVVAMGYSRQGVAIGAAMIGLCSLADRKILHFLFWVLVAALFHKSAVVLAPLAVLSSNNRPVLTSVGVLLSAAGMFVLLLQEMVDALTKNYLFAEMESAGALIRVIMNALPGAFFLAYRDRFKLSESEKSFWTWMSWIALGFVGLLAASPSSTAVDRIALYWIPLQLFVWSRAPDVFGKPGAANVAWVYAIVAYSAMVQFVWLVFAIHASSWLPYQFYPWVWITA